MVVYKLKHLGVLKPDTFVTLLNWVGIPAIVAYFVCMVVYPIIDSSEWQQLQDVWGRWQSLNVAMLAFTSSVIAFNISKYSTEKQRERDFIAAKAYLPASLSELCMYFRSSAQILVQSWRANRNAEFEADAPRLPPDYRDVFSQCIRHAESEVGSYLVHIIVELQVHDSRLRELAEGEAGAERIRPDRRNILAYLFSLGKLQAMVNNLFGFARHTEPFIDRKPNWEDFCNAYGNLGVRIDEIHVDDTMNLEAFTRRAVARSASNNT